VLGPGAVAAGDLAVGGEVTSTAPLYISFGILRTKQTQGGVKMTSPPAVAVGDPAGAVQGGQLGRRHHRRVHSRRPGGGSWSESDSGVRLAQKM
jgi:hypothetical protein